MTFAVPLIAGLAAGATGTAATGIVASTAAGAAAYSAAATIGSAFSTAFPFFQILQGIGQGRAQQQLANQQAIQLEQQAKAQQVQSDYEIEQAKKQNKAYTGAQLAAYGKSGLDISGSPMDVIGNTMFEQELDILARKYNNKIGISKTLGQAQTMRAEGAVNASMARSQGYSSGFGTLLSRGLNG